MADPSEPKSIVDDVIGELGDKRKMSSDMSLEQTNVIKKLKESKTQPGKWLMNTIEYIVPIIPRTYSNDD